MPMDAALSVAPTLDPIECDYLDGENVAWTHSYVQKCQAQLEAARDDRHAAYLRHEVAHYQELLARFQRA